MQLKGKIVDNSVYINKNTKTKKVHNPKVVDFPNKLRILFSNYFYFNLGLLSIAKVDSCFISS